MEKWRKVVDKILYMSCVNWGSIPGRGWEYFSPPPLSDWLWGSPSLCPMGTGYSFPGGKAAGA